MTIWRLVVAALVLLSAGRAAADLSAPVPARDDWGRPEVVLTESIEGGDYLFMALYASGRVLHHVRDNLGEHYRYFTLSAAEHKALLAELPLSHVGQLHPPRRDGKDGSVSCIYAWPRGVRRRDCLWELAFDLRGRSRLPQLFGEPAPADMVTIWNLLTALNEQGRATTPFVAAQLHVEAQLMWGVVQRCSNVAARPWPAHWPLPPHGPGQRDEERRNYRWSFTLPGSELAELERLSDLRTAGDCFVGVAIAGEPFALVFRDAFPHEEQWLPK